MFINLNQFKRDFSENPLSVEEQNVLLSALKYSYEFISEIQEYLPEEKFGIK